MPKRLGRNKKRLHPSIEGKVLDKSDIGREVWYVPNHVNERDKSKWQKGVLSSFRMDSEGNPAIFVRYKSTLGEWTDSANLFWREVHET